ncbi:NTPase, partial [Toxoplasma gondii ARI]
MSSSGQTCLSLSQSLQLFGVLGFQCTFRVTKAVGIMWLPVHVPLLLVFGVSLSLPHGSLGTDSSSLRGVDADTEKRINVGKTHLQTLRNLETRCHDSLQALVVIDAGSSSTRTNVFLAKTRSCPNRGRSIDPDSI